MNGPFHPTTAGIHCLVLAVQAEQAVAELYVLRSAVTGKLAVTI